MGSARGACFAAVTATMTGAFAQHSGDATAIPVSLQQPC